MVEWVEYEFVSKALWDIVAYFVTVGQWLTFLRTDSSQTDPWTCFNDDSPALIRLHNHHKQTWVQGLTFIQRAQTFTTDGCRQPLRNNHAVTTSLSPWLFLLWGSLESPVSMGDCIGFQRSPKRSEIEPERLRDREESLCRSDVAENVGKQFAANFKIGEKVTTGFF